MTLSKTTEYALRVLTLMASDTKKIYSSLYLHDNLKIPKKYLQRLLTGLSKNGLIRSIQGRNGGFVFAIKIEKIFLSDIIDAVEGFSKTPYCIFGFDKCALNDPCTMHNAWSASQEDIIKILSSTKLSDLINKKS